MLGDGGLEEDPGVGTREGGRDEGGWGGALEKDVAARDVARSEREAADDGHAPHEDSPQGAVSAVAFAAGHVQDVHADSRNAAHERLRCLLPSPLDEDLVGNCKQAFMDGSILLNRSSLGFHCECYYALPD